jgi:excisionase family DNA binding protein
MKLSTTQIAERVNLTRARITQLIRDQVIKGEKIGRDWIIDEDQIPIIKNLPDNRGKFRWKKSIKSKKSTKNLQTV